MYIIYSVSQQTPTIIASEAIFLVRSMALNFAIFIYNNFIKESVDSISRDERDAP